MMFKKNDCILFKLDKESYDKLDRESTSIKYLNFYVFMFSQFVSLKWNHAHFLELFLSLSLTDLFEDVQNPCET